MSATGRHSGHWLDIFHIYSQKFLFDKDIDFIQNTKETLELTGEGCVWCQSLML